MSTLYRTKEVKALHLKCAPIELATGACIVVLDVGFVDLRRNKIVCVCGSAIEPKTPHQLLL